MALTVSPLVSLSNYRPMGEPKVGDLLTVKLYGGKVSGARLVRIDGGTYFVHLCGLAVPAPYELGMHLGLDREAIVDWGQ